MLNPVEFLYGLSIGTAQFHGCHHRLHAWLVVSSIFGYKQEFQNECQLTNLNVEMAMAAMDIYGLCELPTND